MKRLSLVFFLSCLAVMLQAQFINNGGTVTIQNGATLRVEGNLTNNSGSTITNDGTIEVMNNFVNSGSIASGASSLIRFIGSSNSNITSGGALFKNAEMAKTASTITLQDAMNVSGTFTFAQANNQVMLGNNNLTIKQGGSVASAGSDRFFNTNGTGKLLKELNANGVLTFEVGNGTQYSPVSCNVTGSSYTSASVGGRVYTSGLTTKYSESTDYITREWDIAATGITDYDNQMTGTYADGDVTGSENLIKGSYYTTDWHFDGSAGDDVNNTVTAQTDNTSVKLTGMNFFGKANLKAFLSGAYNTGTGQMNANLNSPVPANNILEQYALNSPYVDASASVPAGFFLANPDIVDWVKLELRDPGAPGVSTNNKASAFIKKDGSIVGIDGSSLPRVKNGYATSVVVLSHRNHLSIRTVNTGLDVVNPTLHDFSEGLFKAYDNIMNFINRSMVEVNPNVFGLYRGNVNGNTTLNAADLSIVKNESNPSQTNVYNRSDVNLSGTVNAADLSIVKVVSNPSKNAHL